MAIKTDYSDVKFKNNGKLKLLIIVGTRPEIIRLSAVIDKCRKYFDCILAHTGQNYDYNLNGVFFKDLKLADPEVYMDAVGDDLGATVGNIINCSYKLMNEIKPDALLILGDTNSCLSAISAKRLHIPIFHMEAGNRCKDECLPEETNRRIVDIISDVNLAYSEHARKYLHECGLPKERVYVTGSPMDEVLHKSLKGIEASQILTKLNLEPNNLQMNAFAVISDSGTLPEESSFFTSQGHPFPAVCIRTSTERPEALDKACFILAGIDENGLLQAVDTAVQMNEDGEIGIPVPDYVEENVSTKVVKIIQSYTNVVNKMVWRKF